MDRVRLPCLACLPVVALGSVLAHAGAYAFAEPDGHARAELLAGTGHGYLDRTAAAVAVLAALGVLALVARAFRTGAPARPPAWPFALVPPLGFAVQEPAERLAHGDGLAVHLVAERAIVLGLVLQAAVGLLGWVGVRLLTRGAGALGEAVRRTLPRAVVAAGARRPRSAAPPRPPLRRRAPLAVGIARRGPPTPSV